MSVFVLTLLISATGAATDSAVESQPPPAPIFDTQIIPVLTKAGCNAGACHGAAAGRGGMALSLWGSDPAADYQTLVSAFEGRRVNRVHPEESLILLKSSGEVDHGGNIALPAGSPGATLLLAWIKAGARRDPSPPLTAFKIRAFGGSRKDTIPPGPILVDHSGTLVRLQAMARFGDGPEIDVTPWTVFTTGDSSAVAIEENDERNESENSSRVVVKRRGRFTLLGRYLDRLDSLTLVWPMSNAPVDLSAEPANNLIDEEIVKTLSLLRIPASGQADDAAYLRRIRLDLTGRLPGIDEIEAYVKDRSADKKATLVDRLLTSREFADFWTLRTARHLGIQSLQSDAAAMIACTGWLKKSLAEGMPMNQWARELLMASGDSHVVGAAYFSRMANDARGHAELVSRVFLGARLQCANCHNHPLDRWTQDDYHGLAAIFAKLSRGRIVQAGVQGVVSHPRTGEPALPRIPGERNLDPKADGRTAFADWLLDPANPRFARTIVNRVWKAMMGRGLVEPIDDLRATNPASHPELFDRLARDFIKKGYDLKGFLRQIALSRAYGRSGVTRPGNENDELYFSHALSRRLEPETLLDTLGDVTAVNPVFTGQQAGTRAITLYDPLSPSESLDLLGRCTRRGGCDASDMETGLAAKLHTLNGALLNEKIVSEQGRLAQWLAAGKTDAELIDGFYLLALSRHPAEEEKQGWIKRLKTPDAKERKARFEDFLWALLSSKEFTTNH